MLLDVEKITCDNCATAIRDAILSQDPTAQVTVDAGTGRVRVESAATEARVIEALAAAGYPATSAPPHSGAGSDCCGGCS